MRNWIVLEIQRSVMIRHLAFWIATVIDAQYVILGRIK